MAREEFAKQFGIKRNSYYKNETAETMPGLGTLFQLSDRHDISMDWFLFGKGPKNVSEWERLRKTEADLENRLKQHKHTSDRHLEAEKNRVANAEKRAEEAELKLKAAEKLLETAHQRFMDNQKPGVKELLNFMDTDDRFYHNVILYFQDYK